MQKVYSSVISLATIKILLLACVTTSFSQDLAFSQFYNSPLQFNPATCGITTGPRFVMNYRNQWPQLQQAYISYDVSYDQKFSKSNVSVGCLILNDRQMQGVYNTTQLSGIFSYRIPFTKNLNLNTAIQASYVQRSMDWTKISFGDQIDPNTGQIVYPTSSIIGTDHKGFPDFNIGLLLFSNKFYGGASIKHISQPDQSFYTSSKSTLPVSTVTEIGWVFENKHNHENYLSPGLVFIKQEKFRQLNLGASVGIGPVLGGLSLRHTFINADAIILMAGFKQGIFKMAYSYDSSLFTLKGNSGGSHEISIIINLAESQKFIHNQNRKQISECPQIF